jgi:terminase small subunit-like protein
MRAQEQFDFSRVSDEELYDPDRGFVVGSEPSSAAWYAERRRRDEAKRLEVERVQKERTAQLNAVKGALVYSEDIASEIWQRISCGELLIDICDEENMPTMRRCNQWLKANPDFSALYKESINDRLNVFEEEVLRIADCIKNDFKTIVKNGKERHVVDSDIIARAKLRIDVRFKHLRAMRPEKWAEQSTLNLKQDDGFDPANMTQDELEKTIATFETKARVVKAA